MISTTDINTKHSYAFQSNGIIIIAGQSLDEVVQVYINFMHKNVLGKSFTRHI